MKQKLNIAIVCAFWPPAQITGTELFNIVTAKLLQKNHKVTIITSDSFSTHYLRNLWSNPRVKKGEINKNLTIIRLRHNPLVGFVRYISHITIYFLPQSFMGVKKIRDFVEQYFYGPQLNKEELKILLSKNKFDIIYLSSLPYFLNYQTVKILKNEGLKTKIIFRPNYHTELYTKNNKYYKFVLESCDMIHVWTRAEKKQLNKEYGINKKKIVVIHPPLYKQQKLIRHRPIAHIPPSKKIVLYAGSKNENKGIYRLIEALKPIEHVTLITIGSHDFVWVFYKSLWRPKFLIDLGYVDAQTKESVFSNCNVFCLPSVADSFGFAAFEAWHHKKPVILGKTEVSGELMSKIQGGRVIDTHNTSELTQALSLFLSDRKYSQSVGKTGYNNIMKYYSEAKNKKKYIQLFHI